MSLKKNSKGFTLIELMIVVAIIGILAAVAVPKFADLVTKSKEASVKGSLGSIRSAVSIYYGDTEGVYPNDLFAALTTGNRYMPAVGGVPSLGRYEIPSHALNSGHTGGLYFNASAAAAVHNDTTNSPPQADNSGPLLYSFGTASAGELYINCTHKDTKSQLWSSY